MLMRTLLLLTAVLSVSCAHQLAMEDAPDWAKHLPAPSRASSLLDRPCPPAPARPHMRHQEGPEDAPDRNREVALAWGLQPLNELADDTTRREVRIWPDGGLAYPMLLLRLQETAHGIEGELLGWWFSPPADEEPLVPSMEQFLAGLRCRGRVQRGSFNVCRFCPAENEDWASLWSRLADLGLWSLPDGEFGSLRTVDSKHLVGSDGEAIAVETVVVTMDGEGLAVEILSDGTYTSFRYSLESEEDTELALRARAIFDLVSELRPGIPKKGQ